MLRKIFLLLLACSMGATFAYAQQGRGRFQDRSTIVVTVDGLSCNNNSQGAIPVLSFSFGVTQPASTSTGSGSAAGRASLSDVSITRRADSCTPVLFGASVTGKIFKQVTIVQQDTQKDDTFTVTLNDVLISSFQLGGDQSHEVPSEQIGFSYDKICVADTGTGTKACWDLRLARTF